MSFFRRNWLLIVLMAVAFALAFVVRSTAFDLYSGNKDEPVYVLQAKTLAAGHLTLPLYRDLPFFQPWFTAPRGGHLIFVFPPGYPAVLAVSYRLFGSMLPALGAIAAACVLGIFLFTREVTRSRRVALVAAAMLVASPILVIQSGLFLSYLFTLALGLLFGWALLQGLRERRRGLCVSAGVFLGLVLLTRPLDALLWGLPFGIYLVVVNRRELQDVILRLVWVVVGLLPLGVLMLLFNAHVTGSPTLFPVTAVDPLNKLGFGTRRLVTTSLRVDYTVHAAVTAANTNLQNLGPWAFGSFAGLLLATTGFLIYRKVASTYLVLGIGVSFGIGYLGYWGLKLMALGSEGIGPQYYIPMFVPIVVLGASALVWVWERQRAAAAAVAVVLLAFTVSPMHDKFFGNRDLDEGLYRSPYEALHGAHAPNSLIFVRPEKDPYLLTDLSFAMNPPSLQASTLYAVDRGAANIDLVARRRDRTPYLLVPDAVRTAHGYKGHAVLQKLELQSAAAFVVEQQITNPGNRPVVTASLHVGDRTVTKVVDTASTKGASYTVRWVVAPTGARTGAAGTATPVALPPGTATIAAGARFDTSAGAKPAEDQWEARYAYRSAGGGSSVQLLTPAIAYHRIPIFGAQLLVPQSAVGVLETSALPLEAG